MFSLPRKTLLALEAVLDIACYAGGGTVQSSDISARQGIPRRSLEPILQQLTRSVILAGVRGPRGGYRLARERRRITLGEIIHCIVGEEIKEEPEASQSDLGLTIIQPLWNDLSAEFIHRLEMITLEDLCEQARKAGILTNAPMTIDFTI